MLHAPSQTSSARVALSEEQCQHSQCSRNSVCEVVQCVAEKLYMHYYATIDFSHFCPKDSSGEAISPFKMCVTTCSLLHSTLSFNLISYLAPSCCSWLE